MESFYWRVFIGDVLYFYMYIFFGGLWICSCYEGIKKGVCKHIFGIKICVKDMCVEDYINSIPIGRKKKSRGRPTKRNGCMKKDN